jgi:hypothetical protein
MDVKTPNLLIDSVNERENKVFGDVKGIWIQNEVCQFIPLGWTKFFNNVIAFGLDRTKLQRLSKFDLQPFPNIVRFASYQGELEFLEADVFMYNRKLQSISLTDNNLMIIGSSVFDILPLLSFIKVEIKCFKTMCQSEECIQNLNSNLSTNCQSDQVIAKLQAEIQTLKNSLMVFKKSRDSQEMFMFMQRLGRDDIWLCS